MNKISATKSQSFSLMRQFEKMYGDDTANYYKACLNALYNKQIIPSAIVGGGLRNAFSTAEKWLKDHIAKEERAGNIGKGKVTVSKPAKPSVSVLDGYFYFVKDDSTKTLLWLGWTPSHKGANGASNRAHQLATDLIEYGVHYPDNLQEMLNSNRKLSKQPAEKKSIATNGYDTYKVTSGWVGASRVGDYETQNLGKYNTDHLTRKEKKIYDQLIRLINEKSLRSKVIRLAHSNPELREHLLPLITKSASADPYAYPQGIRVSPESWERVYVPVLKFSISLMERAGFTLKMDTWSTGGARYDFTDRKSKAELTLDLTILAQSQGVKEIESFLRIKSKLDKHLSSQNWGDDAFYSNISRTIEPIAGKKQGRSLAHQYAFGWVKAQGVYVHS